VTKAFFTGNVFCCLWRHLSGCSRGPRPSLPVKHSVVVVGVFLVGPGDQGLLFQHRERVIGDTANIDWLRHALAVVQGPTDDAKNLNQALGDDMKATGDVAPGQEILTVNITD